MRDPFPLTIQSRAVVVQAAIHPIEPVVNASNLRPQITPRGG
jgi:hypothetical protein